MASSTLLKDLEENFFLCPVCLEQFKEPKLLPCLHRYCAECLTKVINGSNDGKIKCSICIQTFAVPDNGIDGFRTDFHIKSVVEFIQSQKEFENKHLKKCVSCSTEKLVSAYCVKCEDFLCEQCYNVHITNKMFTDHKSRTLKLRNTLERNLILDKLATPAENPQCRTHVEENATLCCGTCANEPICVICTYSKHKRHDLHDVTELAKTERELLEAKIGELNKLKTTLYELPKNAEASKKKLNEEVSKQTDILINQQKHEITRIKNKLAERKAEKLQGLAEITRRRKDEERQTNLKYEEDLSKLNKNYEEIRKATDKKYSSEIQHFTASCEGIESDLVNKLQSLDVHLKSFIKSTYLLAEKRINELQKISDDCNQIVEKYENITTLSSSILAAKDEWAQIQCIPDIRTSCAYVIEEMKKEYPQLEFLSDIGFLSCMPNLVVDESTLSAEKAINIKGLKAMGGRITGLASCRNGAIVIFGVASREYTHITVINRKGEIQLQDQIKTEKESNSFPSRYCCYLLGFKVATVCIPDEIGIYDVRNASYIRKHISGVIREWSPDRVVWCVAHDHLKCYILVGTNSKYVYVFNYQLNYIRTITLPDVINGVNDITLHAETLLVCDFYNKRAHAVNMEGSESKLIYEFTKPDHAECNAGPFRVCVDKNDFIYMLWRANDQFKTTLAHYSQDGRQLLTTRKVDNDVRCLSTAEVDESEKLLIAPYRYSSEIVNEYDIIVK